MSELKLYNTLTRTKEVFTPEDEQNVQMYLCGPTVYDFAHIGNARPVIVFDVLFRLLRYKYGENNVTYVRNITDVDDKINARALRDYPDLPLNEAIRNVTEKTATQFHADVKALGCLEPTHEPRATEHIDGMVSIIQTLLDKDHAYIADGAQGKEVLFRVSSMDNYGQLSNRIGKLNEQQEGARVAVESHKENAGDFVLWKQSKDDEPGWSGVFNGEKIHGRPGWHIECSAMSEAFLGKTFDIHGGGLDLIFPHHENEIAQSCCAHGTDKMASIWMHNGYVQVEGKKMSKSDGNFITIHELLKGPAKNRPNWPFDSWLGEWDGAVLRFAILQTHYQEPIDFTLRRLREAANILEDWVEFIAPEMLSGDVSEDDVPSEILAALSDNLNTHKVFTLMYELMGDAKSNRLSKEKTWIQKYKDSNNIRKMFCASMKLLGLIPQWANWHVAEKYRGYDNPFASMQGNAIEFRVNERSLAIASKNFAEADRIRDELLEQGIQLKDGKDPETGERVTTWEVKR